MCNAAVVGSEHLDHRYTSIALTPISSSTSSSTSSPSGENVKPWSCRLPVSAAAPISIFPHLRAGAPEPYTSLFGVLAQAFELAAVLVGKVDGRRTAFSYYNYVSLPAEPSAFDHNSDTHTDGTRRYLTDSGPVVSRRKWAILTVSQYTAIHEKK